MSAALVGCSNWNRATPAPLVRGETPARVSHVLVLAVGFYGNVSAVIVSA